MTVRFNQERLNVWIYKFLLGTLSLEKTKLLKQELERRFIENQTDNMLELKLWAAFSRNDEKPREYFAELLEDLGKRNWGD